MNEWKEVKLGNITSRIGDGLHGTPNYDDNGKYYFINGNNLVKGKITIKSDTRKVNEEEFFKYAKPLSNQTILLSINGTIGNLALYNNEKCMLGKSACYINVDDYTLRSFLYYNFLNKDFQTFIIENATGTTIPNVPLKGLRDYTLLLPPLPEQEAIAEVLSSLDDKIDLLHCQNATLESLAETFFRQWFIEEAKENWQMGMISDFSIHDKKTIQPQRNPTTEYFHYSIPAFDNNRNPVKELGNSIQSSKYTVSKNCILFSKLNPHKDKRIWLLQNDAKENSICSTEFQIILPKEKKYLYFLYGWLSFGGNYNEIASGVGGTSGSHQRIAPATIFDFQCPLVDDEYIDKYYEFISPFFNKISINQTQIQTLTKLRDTLLPKLMSGEVRVKM